MTTPNDPQKPKSDSKDEDFQFPELHTEGSPSTPPVQPVQEIIIEEPSAPPAPSSVVDKVKTKWLGQYRTATLVAAFVVIAAAM
jgi:hypothetical protein